MPKFILSLFFITFLATISNACTFVPIPFCEQIDNGNTILYGKTIALIDKGVRFQIFDLLSGEETNEIVTIYDQAPFECNGTFYLDANSLLPLDLEVIVSIEAVDSLLNPWEELNNYRVSEYHTENRRLLVTDGNVVGNITSPFEGGQIIPLSTFISDVQNGVATCLILEVTNQSTDKLIVFPNPAKNQIFVSFEDRSLVQIQQAFAYDQSGGKTEVFSSKVGSLDVTQLPSGLYVVDLFYSDGMRSRQKVVIVE